ncbi:MAG: (Fe-S)-binding protein [Candidatus Lokiarchaeota archaeon]
MTVTNKKKELSKEDLLGSEILKKVKASSNYCYNCNRCVNVCPLSHLGVFSPRNLINDLAFNSVKDAIDQNNIWLCLTCGQCNIYCPMTKENAGVDIPNLIKELRKISVELEGELKAESDKIAQCETHDGMIPLMTEIMAQNSVTPNKLGFLDGTKLKVKSKGKVAYFIGCLPIMEDIIYDFDVNYTDIPKSVIGLMNEINIAPVVLNEKCCGHDILWGRGDEDTFKKLAEYNVELFRKAGVEKIIFSCAEGYYTWKYEYPKYIKDFNFEIVYFTDFFLENNILDNLRFPQEREIKVTYQDSCRLGRLGDKLYDSPRQLLNKLPSVSLVEMEDIKDDASCCGVSSFTGCNEFTRILRQNRLEEAANTGAEYLIVPCPKCLTHFTCYLNEPALDDKQKELKNKIKVIDLATFIGKLLFMV